MDFDSQRVVKREPNGNLIDYVWKQKVNCAHVWLDLSNYLYNAL